MMSNSTEQKVEIGELIVRELLHLAYSTITPNVDHPNGAKSATGKGKVPGQTTPPG